MNAHPEYQDFLEAKITLARDNGFEVAPEEVNSNLKDFVRAIVIWAARGGRRGIFSSFGLHKTSTQIELARLCAIKTGVLPLIVLPLGVRHEFFDEAQARFSGKYAVNLKFIRSTEDINPRDLPDGNDDWRSPRPPSVYLTNYESVREGKIDLGLFGFASLDEAACLRGFGGTKTFREFMRLFGGVRFRFVATATPDPNEYIELLAYSAFLDVMDVGQAKTRFFKRNSEAADQLTIHPHKEREFWLWVASWALFVRTPSDLGFSDEGYVLPETQVTWHEVPVDHRGAGTERDGQGKLLRDDAIGVQNAAREKRESLPARICKLMEVVRDAQSGQGNPVSEQWVIWCDLNDEQNAIDKSLQAEGISFVSLYGAQDVDERETLIAAWKRKERSAFVSKPRMYGAGVNLQQCHRMIFAGIGFKFHDLIQAVHRCHRFGQQHPVQIDLIYSEAEREVRRRLEQRWVRHVQQAETMSRIIREYGLAQVGLAGELARTMGVDRAEASGEGWTMVNNDCVVETRQMEADSVDLIVTSIPFSTQYEYTPSYNDFGHTDDDDHFFRQMDFLVPELLRVLRPGRVAAIHCKDRIVPGGLTGLGFQTVSPFGWKTLDHFMRHGFAYIGTKTIVTDVVRENNQTYRLGWTEQCKDGSRMGFGLPEYLHIFRKPPSDRSNGYADAPVVKEMPLSEKADGSISPWKERVKQKPIPGTGYSRGRWQWDAHGFGRSSGNRLLTPDDIVGRDPDLIFKMFRQHSLKNVYDFERDVALAEALDYRGELPPIFMLMQPQSWHPDVWTDVTRMQTLNGLQHAKGRELHLCPLQFDIVDRAITQYTMPGELVFDPFAGIGTVPYRALLAKRRGLGVELSTGYWRDAIAYCEAAVQKVSVPSLFDLEALDSAQAQREAAE